MKTLTDCKQYFLIFLPIIAAAGKKGIRTIDLMKKSGVDYLSIGDWLCAQKRPGKLLSVDVKTHTYTLSPTGKATLKTLPSPRTFLAPIILGALKPSGAKGLTPKDLAAKTKLSPYICSAWLRNNSEQVDKVAGGRYVVAKHPPAPYKPSPPPPPVVSPHMKRAWPALLDTLPVRAKKLVPTKGSKFPLPPAVLEALDDQDYSHYILQTIDNTGVVGKKCRKFPYYIGCHKLFAWLSKHKGIRGWVKKKSDGCYVTTPSGKKELLRLAKIDLTKPFLLIIADSAPRGISVDELVNTTSLPYDLVLRRFSDLSFKKGMLERVYHCNFVLSALGEVTRQKLLGIYIEPEPIVEPEPPPPIVEPDPITIPPLVIFSTIDDAGAKGITIPDIAKITKFSVRDVEFSLKDNYIIEGNRVIKVGGFGLHVLTPQGKKVHLKKLKGEVIEADTPDF